MDLHQTKAAEALRPHASSRPLKFRAVLAIVKAASRRLRRWPSASLDDRCARRAYELRPGRRNGLLRPNKETDQTISPASRKVAHVTHPQTCRESSRSKLSRINPVAQLKPPPVADWRVRYLGAAAMAALGRPSTPVQAAPITNGAWARRSRRRQVETGLCPARQRPARFDGRPPRPDAPLRFPPRPPSSGSSSPTKPRSGQR